MEKIKFLQKNLTIKNIKSKMKINQKVGEIW